MLTYLLLKIGTWNRYLTLIKRCVGIIKYFTYFTIWQGPSLCFAEYIGKLYISEEEKIAIITSNVKLIQKKSEIYFKDYFLCSIRQFKWSIYNKHFVTFKVLVYVNYAVKCVNISMVTVSKRLKAHLHDTSFLPVAYN